jgi:hypothetical protein
VRRGNLVLMVAGSAMLIYLSWPVGSRTSSGLSDEFTVGMAILIAGYVFYPVLAFLAIGLLVIALMLFVAGVMERRQA